jgi:hypothetical protein
MIGTTSCFACEKLHSLPLMKQADSRIAVAAEMRGVDSLTQPLDPTAEAFSLLEEERVDAKSEQQETEHEEHRSTDTVGASGEDHQPEPNQKQHQAYECHRILPG